MTQPEEFTSDKYYVITKHKVFVFILINIALTMAVIALLVIMGFTAVFKFFT